jgi:hypothetical protein
MTPVRVPGAVGVVLEDIDLTSDPLLLETLLGTPYQALEDPLSRLVVGDDVFEVVALGGCELGVGADIEIETGPVLEKHVRRPPPGDDTPKEITGDLIGAETTLAPQGAGDPVLIFEPEDATIHNGRLSGVWDLRASLFSARVARPV